MDLFEEKQLQWMWAFRMLAIVQILWLITIFTGAYLFTAVMVVDSLVFMWLGALYIQSLPRLQAPDRRYAWAFVGGATFFVLTSVIWRRPLFTENVELDDALATGYPWFLISNIGLAIAYYAIGSFSEIFNQKIENFTTLGTLFITAAIIDLLSALGWVVFGNSVSLATVAGSGKMIVTPILVAVASIQLAKLAAEHKEQLSL